MPGWLAAFQDVCVENKERTFIVVVGRGKKSTLGAIFLWLVAILLFLGGCAADQEQVEASKQAQEDSGPMTGNKFLRKLRKIMDVGHLYKEKEIAELLGIEIDINNKDWYFSVVSKPIWIESVSGNVKLVRPGQATPSLYILINDTNLCISAEDVFDVFGKDFIHRTSSQVYKLGILNDPKYRGAKGKYVELVYDNIAWSSGEWGYSFSFSRMPCLEDVSIRQKFY